MRSSDRSRPHSLSPLQGGEPSEHRERSEGESPAVREEPTGYEKLWPQPQVLV